MDTGFQIILIRKAENITITGFDENHFRMLDLTDVLRNERPSALVLLVGNWEAYGIHWFVYKSLQRYILKRNHCMPKFRYFPVNVLANLIKTFPKYRAIENLMCLYLSTIKIYFNHD